jgi:hypothetical protein
MMPSVSKKQHNFMEAIAHSKSFAKKVGVPQSVGKDFSAADKGRKFSKGGTMAKSDMKEDMKADIKQDKAIVKKAFKMHDAQEHKGSKGTNLSKLAKGGVAASKMGSVKTAAPSRDGIASKGKTKGTMIAMKRGGKC